MKVGFNPSYNQKPLKQQSFQGLVSGVKISKSKDNTDLIKGTNLKFYYYPFKDETQKQINETCKKLTQTVILTDTAKTKPGSPMRFKEYSCLSKEPLSFTKEEYKTWKNIGKSHISEQTDTAFKVVDELNNHKVLSTFFTSPEDILELIEEDKECYKKAILG